MGTNNLFDLFKGLNTELKLNEMVVYYLKLPEHASIQIRNIQLCLLDIFVYKFEGGVRG